MKKNINTNIDMINEFITNLEEKKKIILENEKEYKEKYKKCE